MACRVCNSSLNATDIFEVEWEAIDGNSLPACIGIMTGVEITPSDKKPTKICPICVKAIRKHMLYRLRSFRYLEEKVVPIAAEEDADCPTPGVSTSAKPFACCLCYGSENLLNVLESELTFVVKTVERDPEMGTGDDINFNLMQKICQVCLSSLRLVMNNKNLTSASMEVIQDPDCSTSDVDDDIVIACYICYGGSNLINIFNSEYNIFGHSLPEAIEIVTGNEITYDEDHPHKICQYCFSALGASLENRDDVTHEVEINVTVEMDHLPSGHTSNMPYMVPFELEESTEYPSGVDINRTTFMVPAISDEHLVYPRFARNHRPPDMVCNICHNTFNLMNICENIPIISQNLIRNENVNEEVSTGQLPLRLCPSCLERINMQMG